jgi:hypothetical protein
MEGLRLILDSSFTSALTSIINDSVNLAKSSIKDKSTQIELEFRLGVPAVLDAYNKKWNFNPFIDANIFNSLKSKLDALASAEKIVDTVSTKNLSPTLKIREIKSVASKSSKIYYQLKETKQSVDSTFLSSTLDKPGQLRNVHMMRFALSIENNDIDSSLEGKYKNISDLPNIRNRERYHYKFLEYALDLTIVDYKNYSIELEYSTDLLLSIDSSKQSNPAYILGEKMFPPIKSLLKMCFPNLPAILSVDKITEKYLKLIDDSKERKNISEVRPQNIKESEVSLLKDYSFTNKLNGTKYRLIFTAMGSYILKTDIDVIFAISDTDIKYIYYSQKDGFLSKYIESVIDIELYQSQSVIELHAITSIIWQDKIVASKPHDYRISVLSNDNFDSKFNEMLKPVGYLFEIKKFFYTNNPANDCVSVLKYMYLRYGDKLEEFNDGIIQTPVKAGYYDKTPIYKLKFPGSVSIDFLLEHIDDITKFNIEQKVYNLYCIERGELKLFGPYNREKYYNPPSVFLSEKGSESYNIKSGTIVELGFDKSKNEFRMLKLRSDKTIPNSLRVAELTFVDMENPFTLERFYNLLTNNKMPVHPIISTISQSIESKNNQQDQLTVQTNQSKECLKNYRKFHNLIKSGLIKKWAKNKRILDLGAGKGGDLSKYNPTGITYLWAVEPNQLFINGPQGFKERLEKYDLSFKQKVQIINAKAEDTKTISNALISTKNFTLAQTVVSFFSLTFFFKSIEILTALAKTIASNLESEGYFVATFLDGKAIYDQLALNNSIIDQEKCYSITRKYSDTEPFGIGLEISFNISDTPTVQGSQSEWLVDFELLKTCLEKENMNLIVDYSFDNETLGKNIDASLEINYNEMSPGEKKLNSFYRYCVFQKQKSELKKHQELQVAKRVINSLEMLSPQVIEKGQYISKEIFPEELYRVGVQGKGACFYASIVYSLIPAKYNSLNDKEQTNLITRFRSLLADLLTLNTFSNLANGAVELTRWIPYLMRELELCYITGVISQNEVPDITKDELNNIISTASSMDTIQSQIEYIEKELTILGAEQSDLTILVRNARIRCYLDYKKDIRTFTTWAQYDTMEYIMNSIRKNIFIIIDSQRRPIHFTNCKNYNSSWKSIFVLNLEGLDNSSPHFEPLVDIYEIDGDVIQQTIFDFDKPLTSAIYNAICENTN